jgi:hypothetical protein
MLYVSVIVNLLQEKGVEATKQKEERREKKPSPRNTKACHTTSNPK